MNRPQPGAACPCGAPPGAICKRPDCLMLTRPIAPALTNAGFVGYASRIAAKAAHWSADTAQCFFIAPPDAPIEREPAMRFIGEMRRVLDHMEGQVQP